jgi:hypothetical protein
VRLRGKFTSNSCRNGTTLKDEVSKVMKKRIEEEYGRKQFYKNT